jgi:thioredoxin reductase
VGAGPAGLSSGLRAKELNLSYLILERKKVCSTILETYTSGKLVTDFPKEHKVKGNFWFERCTTEELLEKWQEIANGLEIHENEEVLDVVKKNDEIFQIRSNKNTYKSKALVIAIGKEGKPRKIGVKGEDLSEKVFYKLKDAKDFKNRDILIVGGGDSAIDAALHLCENNEVIISYRKPAFFRLNEENLRKVEEKCQNYELEVIFNSNVMEIKDKSVILEIKSEEKEIKNDFVFIFAGSELPIEFFRKIEGVEIVDDKVVLDEHFQTSLKNLFTVGDASGRPPFLIKTAINQGYEVVEFISKNLE